MDSAVPVIQLQPGSGILGLSFGAMRHAVYEFFGVPQMSDRSPLGGIADGWWGVVAHFSSDDRLQGLESGPQCACMLDGTMISALDFDGAVAVLSERDQETLSHSEATHFGQLSMTFCRSGCGSAVERHSCSMEQPPPLHVPRHCPGVVGAEIVASMIASAVDMIGP